MNKKYMYCGCQRGRWGSEQCGYTTNYDYLPLGSGTVIWDSVNDAMVWTYSQTIAGELAVYTWREYAIRLGGTLLSSTGCGPISNQTGATKLTPGWQLNHALIPGGFTHNSGQILQVIVKITVA